MSFPETSVMAVVPLRAGGKTRLGAAVSRDHRTALAAAMFVDVCGALTEAGVGRIVVAANGPAALHAAEGLDVEVVPDPPSSAGLDHAVAHAAAGSTPTGGLLVVAADLPCLRPADVTRLLGSEAAVVIAPTGDGGTGALLRRPADVIGTAYGPGSARRHRRLAVEAGVTCDTVEATGFDDVDTLGDLRGLAGGDVGPATRRVLARLGMDGRAAG
jgi:2-phospho-L-lactate/phosphoenolpyruvate guanylyltransferase